MNPRRLLAAALVVVATGAYAADPDAFVVHAHLADGTLHVRVDSPQPLGEDHRKPLLQLDLPEGVAPAERPLETLKTRVDYQNHYLGFPWARSVLASELAIPLRIDDGATGRIGLNVTTYLDGDAPEDAVFVRRRLELAVRDGAEAEVVDAVRTTWGRDDLVHVGDRAPDFDLPSGDGEALVLSQEIAKKQPVFLLTYRADW